MAKTPPSPPPEVAELVACVGEALAFRLIEERGGTRVYVPLPGGIEDSWMMPMLGREPLRRLAQALGGSLLKLPTCRRWRAQTYLHKGGMSHAEIALKSGLTETYVQRLAHADWTPMPSTNKALRDRAATVATKQMSLPLV